MGCNKSTQVAVPGKGKQTDLIGEELKKKGQDNTNEAKVKSQIALDAKVKIQPPFPQAKVSQNPSANPPVRSHNQLDNSSINIMVPSTDRQLPDLTNFLSLQSKPPSRPNDKKMMAQIPEVSAQNVNSTEVKKVSLNDGRDEQLKIDSVVRQNSLVIEERLQEQEIKVMEFSSSISSMKIWDEQMLSPFDLQLPRVQIRYQGAF